MVYADEYSLYVLSGPDGSELLNESRHESATWFEYPATATLELQTASAPAGWWMGPRTGRWISACKNKAATPAAGRSRSSLRSPTRACEEPKTCSSAFSDTMWVVVTQGGTMAECEEDNNLLNLGAWPLPDPDQDGDGVLGADCGGAGAPLPKSPPALWQACSAYSPAWSCFDEGADSLSTGHWPWAQGDY